MKVNNIFQKEGTNTSTVLLWSTFVVYSLILAFLGSRHEHWHDEWHVWFMCFNDSPKRLLIETAGDGHFIPWQMLNYPFVKLGCGFGSLELLSCTLCAIGGWILLFKAPFNYLCKVLILVSFPMLYSFPVLARCYALIPPIIFAIGYLYQKLPNHKYLYCTCVGLLALTHSYMEGMVGALFLLYCYEHIYLPYKGKKEWKKNFGPAAVTGAFIICALLHMLVAVQIAKDNNIHRIDTSAELLNRLFDTYAIQPFYSFSLSGSMTLPNLDLAITLFAWTSVLVALYKIFWNDPKGKRLAIVGFVSIAYMLIFGTSIYFMVLQRLLLPFLVIIALIWGYYHVSRSKYISLAVIWLVVMTSFNHYSEIYADITRSYCNAVEASMYIRKNIPTDAILAGGNQYGFMWELLYKDYICYELESKENVLTDQIFDDYTEKHPCQVFYLISADRHSFVGEEYKFCCVFDENAQTAILHGFYIYKVEKVESNNENQCIITTGACHN